MKKIKITLFFLFLIGSLLLGLIETPWIQRWVLHRVTKALQQSDIQVQIEKTQGSFPHHIKLAHISIQGKNWHVTAETVELDLSLWKLFKKELFIRSLKGETISWDWKENSGEPSSVSISIPFSFFVHSFTLKNVQTFTTSVDLEGMFRVSRKGKMRTEVQIHEEPHHFEGHLLALGPLQGPYHGDFSGKWNPFSFSGVFTWSWPFTGRFDGHLMDIPHMAPLAFKLDLNRKKEPTKYIHLTYQTTHWALNQFPIENVSGEIEATFQNETLQGMGKIRGNLYQQLWNSHSDFNWSQNLSLQMNCWKIEGPFTQAQGNLSIFPDKSWRAEGTIDAERMQAWNFPFVTLFGALHADFKSAPEEERQKIDIQGNSQQLFVGPFFAENLTFDSQWENPLDGLSGTLHASFTQGKYKELQIEKTEITAAYKPGAGTYKLSFLGAYKHPLELQMKGTFDLKKHFSVDTASGKFSHYPLVLVTPLNIEKDPSSFSLSHSSLQVGEGTIQIEYFRKNQEVEGKIFATHVPVEILSVNPVHIPMKGFFDLESVLDQKEEKLTASLRAHINELEIGGSSHAPALRTSGAVEIDYDSQNLKGSISFNSPQAHLDFSLPVDLHIHPWKVDLKTSQRVEIDLAYRGKIDEILDFFDLGTHHLEGNLDCSLSLRHTLEDPEVKGTLFWKNGVYQNYYTGTDLSHLEAECKGAGEALVFTLNGQDEQKKGTLSAVGKVQLTLLERFPFEAHVTLNQLNAIEIDWVQTALSGQIDLKGTLDRGMARGKVALSQTVFMIPDQIPKSLPQLKVTYRNPIHPVELPKLSELTPYPLELELSVFAPQGIFITGRGLNSEWKGDFSLQGTINSPRASGKLELLRGDFEFASRHFNLTEGFLSLSGKEHEMPHLNIAASVEQNGVIITARLRGPLNQPQLTFQSTPPLPMSSILAYLLFGEDVSEINGIQALQLANSIANIAGEGPNVLENTRKMLGVDRLRIITVPSNAEERTDAIALQVGKYVAKGVIISVSQGAEDSSTNISIEVELKYGLSFLAETQQQQEQGKFTLKWNLHY